MMTHEESYLTRLIDRLLLEPSAVTEIGLRKLHKEAADMLHLLSAAPQTAAVQPQEPVAWRFTHNHGHGRVAYTYHDNEPSNDYRTAYRDTCIEVTPLYAAPLARQEPKPDAVYPVQPSSEADTARDAARYLDALVWALGAHDTDGFRERSANEGPYWWRKELAERAGLRWNGEMFVSSTPAQGDGGTGDLSAVDRITDENRHGEAWPDGVQEVRK